MAPENYVVIYQCDNENRIFVLFTADYGDFVLTKDCKGDSCGCLGCMLFQATVGNINEQHPVLDLERREVVGDNLICYPFTEEGKMLLLGLKHEKYKKYRGTISKSNLDEIYRVPDALLFVKTENDGTFTHTYMSATIDKRIISRGCRSGTCPCVGCRIVDMLYVDEHGNITPAVDKTAARSTEDGELVLPVFSEGEKIISKLLNRDADIRHEFSHKAFDSPLEQMFYELAFLDLHIYPQHKVGKFRLDFAIPEKRIAIELDGHEYHKTKYQRTHDAKRDRWLFGQGWNVLRFTGTEIYKNLDKCIDEICQLSGVDRLTKPSI